MDVEPGHLEPGLAPGCDRLERGLAGQAELRPVVRRSDRLVRVRLHAGCHAHEHTPNAGRRRALDLAELVEDDDAGTGVRGRPQLLVALVVAVHDESLRAALRLAGRTRARRAWPRPRRVPPPRAAAAGRRSGTPSSRRRRAPRAQLPGTRAPGRAACARRGRAAASRGARPARTRVRLRAQARRSRRLRCRERAPARGDCARIRALRFVLSLPERIVRATVAVAGGAVHETAQLVLPRLVRRSRLYEASAKNLLRVAIELVGGVEGASTVEPGAPAPRELALRKGAGNVVELGSIAAFGFSPLWLLAGASDVAHGSRVYLAALTAELKRARRARGGGRGRLGRRAAGRARARERGDGAADRRAARRARRAAALARRASCGGQRAARHRRARRALRGASPHRARRGPLAARRLDRRGARVPALGARPLPRRISSCPTARTGGRYAARDSARTRAASRVRTATPWPVTSTRSARPGQRSWRAVVSRDV